ncbi:MAG: hypothetical protein PHF35_04210 [Candidatus Moranbacteria bacterium]|nr:hypothetical protein [Candidatus Moranbacteria bacterium]
MSESVKTPYQKNVEDILSKARARRRARKDDQAAEEPPVVNSAELTSESIAEAKKSGKDMIVKVKRSTGEYQDGWKVIYYHKDGEYKGEVVVSKNEEDGKITTKTIPLSELNEWQKENGEAAGEPPVVAAGSEAVVAEPVPPGNENTPTTPLNSPKPPISAPEVIERSPAKEESDLDKLKADLEEKKTACIRLEIESEKKWKKLRRILGSGVKEVKDEDLDKAWDEYEIARENYFLEKRREALVSGDKGKAKEFLLKFEGTMDALDYLNSKYSLRSKDSGFPEKMKTGFLNIAQGWKDMNWKKRIAVSAAVAGTGIAAVTVFSPGTLSFGLAGGTAMAARTAQRFIGAGAAYIGAKKWQDSRAFNKQGSIAGKNIESILSDNEWQQRIAKFEYGESAKRFFEKKNEIMDIDKKHSRRALALAGILAIGGTTYDAYRQGYFSWIGKVKEKLLGSAATTSTMNIDQGLQAKPKIPEQAPAPKPGIVPGEQDIKPNSTIQKIAGEPAVGAKVEAKINIADMNQPKGLIGQETIAKGGGIERSAKHIIKANAEKFGLDPNDPKLELKAGQKAHVLARQMAENRGISYEKLNEIASHKVQPGEGIKIITDSNGKPMIEYDGKAFGSMVPKHAAGAEVSAPKTAPKVAAGAHDAPVGRASAVPDRSGMGTHGADEPKKPDWMKPFDENMARAKRNFDYYNVKSDQATAAWRVSQEQLASDSEKLVRITDLIHNRGSFVRIFDFKHLDWDQPAENYLRGNPPWDNDFQKRMADALIKKIGSPKNISLKEWLGKISNEQFRLVERSVRAGLR